MPTLNKFLYGAIALLLISLLTVTLYARALSAEVDAKKAEIAALVIINNAMKTSIDNQNSAIDKLNKDEIERAKEAAIAIAKAHGNADKYRKKAETIKNQIVTGDDCQGANFLFSDYIKGSVL